MHNSARNWEELWKSRGSEDLEDTGDVSLPHLIKLAGYDSGAVPLSGTEFSEGVFRVRELLSLNSGHEVLDLGCGPGGLAFVLGEGSGIGITGIDISRNLVDVAARAAPFARFKTMNLAGIGRNGRSIVGTWDFVVALSLFQYLSPDNAVGLFREALRLARGGVLISDVPDAERFTESEELRRQSFGAELYKQQYSSLPHNYHYGSAFESVLEEPEFIGSWSIEIVRESVFSYAQGKLRMTLLARRLGHRPERPAGSLSV